MPASCSTGSTRTASRISRPGRIRYGVLTTDGGRIMDDGTVARLARRPLLRHDDLDRVGRGVRVVRVVERGLGLRRRDRQRHRRARGREPRRARRRARRWRRSPTADVSNEALGYLDAQASSRSPACRASRCGSASSASSATSSTARRARPSTSGTRSSPPAPCRSGSRPQRVLRLEKAHVIVGQDTDSESNLLSAGMPWILKLDKGDFVGALRRRARPGARRARAARRLHAARRRSLPAEGAQVVAGGRPAGRVTSARASERLGRTVGLAWVEPELRRGRSADLDPGRRRGRHGHGDPGALLRPDGSEAARVTRLAFLSPATRRPGRPSSRRSARRSRPGVTDVSHLGKLELRGARRRGRAGPGEELLPLGRAGRCSSSTAPPRRGARASHALRASAPTT